jgi:hypothetical protein
VGVRRVLILGAALVLTGCGTDGAADAPPPSIARDAPEISGVTLDGDRLALSALQGKPVVVNVWSSW